MPRPSRKQPTPPPKPTLSILHEEATTSKPIYFHKPNEPNGYLCQWYPSPLHDPTTNLKFTCCEQYMMYHKALHFADTESAAVVMATDNPHEHKTIGKNVRGFKAYEWDKVKRDVVVQGNMLKFGQCVAPREDGFVYPPPELVSGRLVVKQGVKAEEVSLRELLLATGDRELVEAAPGDRVWGVGFGAAEAERLRGVNREKWGSNYLGKALMEVRRGIRAEENGEEMDREHGEVAEREGDVEG
ncbi:hypothetical protein PMZ80_009144 [Knufia obscura]|uniref:NADAR domain-containing protein n=2 Tax=Knufia TaxID=430999 RepID=A0AAN8ES46_9EURO|nr:hypothetical protein PMZ80_009144 [Knufia obscura]KAK5954900.1 hypothetical protein OHC33_003579 [Knufia fluminis]